MSFSVFSIPPNQPAQPQNRKTTSQPQRQNSNTTLALSLSLFFRRFSFEESEMPSGFAKCSKIRHIVRLRQMLRLWRNKARVSANRAYVPSDVPAGHVAVCVGSGCRRFVVRATHLNHPAFQKLLSQAEEEYGFSTGHSGPLAIPCDESFFEEVLRHVTRNDNSSSSSSSSQRHCHVGLRSSLDFWADSRPLLQGVAEKHIW